MQSGSSPARIPVFDFFWRQAYSPVNMLYLEGVQVEAVAYPCWKTMPRLARESMFGVLKAEAPAQLKSPNPKSSAIIKTTFFLSDSAKMADANIYNAKKTAQSFIINQVKH